MKNFKLSAIFIFKVYYMYVCRSIDKTTPCKGYTQGRRKKNLIVADFLTPLHPYGKNRFIVDTDFFFLSSICIAYQQIQNGLKPYDLREKIIITLNPSEYVYVSENSASFSLSRTNTYLLADRGLPPPPPSVYGLTCTLLLGVSYAFPQR